MANFLEFLKSGKTAKEFIDSAVLPQRVLPVERTEFSPEPYENEELASGGGTDAVLDAASADQLDESAGKKTEDADYGDEDAEFIAMLEAAEKEGFREDNQC